jgi:hypothetical protein
MPTAAPQRFLQQPDRLIRTRGRARSRAYAAHVHDRGAARLGLGGLMLIVMTCVLYLPVGPQVIYNELVYGPSHLSETVSKVWSGGRYLAALVVAPVLLMARPGLRPFSRCWPALPFAIFAATSIAWSSFPKESMRQSLNLFAVIVLTSTMVSWYGLSGFGRRMQIVTGLIMIASVLTALLFPRVGVHHAYDLLESVHAGNWRGVFIHKNVLGGVAVMSMIYSLRSIRNETRPWQVFFSMARISSVICCIMAGSVAAWGGGLIAVIFIILMKHRATANPLFICAMILIGVALVQGLSLSAERIAEALGRDPTSPAALRSGRLAGR